MTPELIKTVQESFAKIVSISEQAAALLYGNLFEIALSVKPPFCGDIKEQGRKLIATLVVVVNGRSNLPAILPAARELAKRQVQYGAKHYTPVGAALLWTLERGLGSDWTPELATAWGPAYGILSGFMITEAYDHSAAAEC
jgi:hemoglobin-like flavoprotein